ncbi:MAG: hypothetical protein GY854_19730 [Deltaproteobacteria bacterium]|nr:hypothetical protein [Deltaproteobacteria bacterium]
MPPHAGGLQLGHNPHKASYETVERYEQGIEYFDWISEEERKAAIETDSIWVLQWYPKTPIGFLCIAASSLEAIIKYLESNPE